MVGKDKNGKTTTLKKFIEEEQKKSSVSLQYILIGLFKPSSILVLIFSTIIAYNIAK